MRRGEHVHLWWEDVDFENGLVHVRIKEWTDEDGVEHQWTPKGRRERTIPMHPRLKEILARQPRRGRSVFTTEEGRDLDRALYRSIHEFQNMAGWRVTCHLREQGLHGHH